GATAITRGRSSSATAKITSTATTTKAAGWIKIICRRNGGTTSRPTAGSRRNCEGGSKRCGANETGKTQPPRPAAANGRQARGSLVSNEATGSATAGQGVLDGVEGAVGVVAQGRDRTDADHDDQGEHDRVFNGGRAIFGLDELDQVFGELTHDSVLSGLVRPPVRSPDSSTKHGLRRAWPQTDPDGNRVGRELR